ncbi:MAG: hypothetical protein COA70_10065 [Planctomycetota bacterium]|nr:MAG: hypothetical protein COA70_10065 [Planctomycetota bacterium]
MHRRLPNPTLAEINISLTAICSYVFGFLFLIVPLILMPLPVVGHMSAAEAIQVERFWGWIALVAMLFSIQLFMQVISEFLRGPQRRFTTMALDLLAAGVQLYLWYGASATQKLISQTIF